MTTAADYVRDARKQLGMTQVQLARALGVTPRAVKLWESGHTLTMSRRQHIELLLKAKRKR